MEGYNSFKKNEDFLNEIFILVILTGSLASLILSPIRHSGNKKIQRKMSLSQYGRKVKTSAELDNRATKVVRFKVVLF